MNGLVITDVYGACRDMTCIEWNTIESISIKNYK